MLSIAVNPDDHKSIAMRRVYSHAAPHLISANCDPSGLQSSTAAAAAAAAAAAVAAAAATVAAEQQQQRTAVQQQRTAAKNSSTAAAAAAEMGIADNLDVIPKHSSQHCACSTF